MGLLTPRNATLLSALLIVAALIGIAVVAMPDRGAVPPAAPAHVAANGAAAASGPDRAMPMMAERLERRLQERDPDDGQGWTLLGRAYVVLGRPGEAVQAFARARKLLGDGDAQRLVDHAEAIVQSRGRFDGEARALIAAAVAADATNPKALQLQASARAAQAPIQAATSPTESAMASAPHRAGGVPSPR
jgi:cytochrome c-type biogenesis protein CcmH